MDWHQRADDAANWLTETDRQIADLKVKHERDKRKAKRMWSAMFLRGTGNIEERKAQATLHPEYELAEEAEMASLLEYEALNNRRETANTVIEFWRSWQKARGQGMV